MIWVFLISLSFEILVAASCNFCFRCRAKLDNSTVLKINRNTKIWKRLKFVRDAPTLKVEFALSFHLRYIELRFSPISYCWAE